MDTVYINTVFREILCNFDKFILEEVGDREQRYFHFIMISLVSVPLGTNHTRIEFLESLMVNWFHAFTT